MGWTHVSGVTIVHGDCLTANLGDANALAYCDPPFYSQQSYGAFDDVWNSRTEFLSYLLVRLVTVWDSLRPGGVLAVHLDPRMAPYVRVHLEQAIGVDKWESEIVWSYASGGASKRRLAAKHDVINVWRKYGDPRTFNIVREPYATPNVADRAGFHPQGRMLTDVWSISFIGTSSSERVGYPTQKPEALLERLLTIYSDVGDCVLDPFAGSGTTGAVAAKLGRSAILVDQSNDAVATMASRLCVA